MNDEELWRDIKEYPVPNNVTVELANIIDNIIWDSEIIWQTTGRYKNGKLYSIRYVDGLENNLPTHWRPYRVNDLENAREIIYGN